METTPAVVNNGVAKSPPTLQSLLTQDNVKKRFEEMLGKKAAGFISSIISATKSNAKLAACEPNSVISAAVIAATLDLPIQNNLGFAYIVPYNQSYKDTDGQWKKKQVAQFQLGYKGFIQLAQRSGRFKTIASAPIYEGQLIEENPLTGFLFDFTKKDSKTIIGYAAYFSLINGFEKTLYMTIEELNKHGKTFSQTFKNDKGLWKDNFDAMASKTVLKLLLSKFAPLSIEMERAVLVDQSVINNADTTDVTYVDNTPMLIDPEETAKEKERERIKEHIAKSKTKKQLEEVKSSLDKEDGELWDLYDNKLTEL